LLIGISGTHAIAPALLQNVPYKPDRDFTPLARIA
jgi:tripartite-type tricarboxylate transporter receptor subunit TctC